MALAYSIGKSQREAKHQDLDHTEVINQERLPLLERTQSRLNYNIKETPGVGSYQVTKQQNDASQYTIRPRNYTKDDNGVPGSGTYKPDMYKSYKQSVGYTMGFKTSKSEKQIRDPIPGPGNYQDLISSVQNRPSSVFGSDQNRFKNVNKNPGPGQYQQPGRQDTLQKPSWGFGTEQRSGFNQPAKNPGPGTYNHKSALDPFYSRSTMGKTMTSKRSVSEQSNVPGAGSYDPKFSDKKLHPTCRIGTSKKDEFQKNKVPGAGSYNPNFATRPSSQSVMVGTSTRKPLDETERTPGPGTYEIPNKSVGGYYTTIKGAYHNGVLKINQVLKEQNKVPGSGTYNPSIEQVRRRPKTSIIGTGQRHDVRKGKIQVGPGYYELRGQPGEQYPKFPFGTEIQRPFTKRVVPGPGTYEIKPMFADVPKYSIEYPQSSKYL